MSEDLIKRLTAWGESVMLSKYFMGTVSAKETCTEAAAELTRLEHINRQLVRDFNALNTDGARQDAELARLRARIDAADKMAEALMMCPPTSNPTVPPQEHLMAIDAWWRLWGRTALSAYGDAKK